MFKPIETPTALWWLPLLPILQQASDILKQEYQNYRAGCQFNIEHKGDDSPITQADFRVNHFLMQVLSAWQPDLPVLSEESDNSKRDTWSRCWMLDPLDGTKEFIQQRDEFTINLSLIEGHDTVFAAIVVPCQNLLYIGDVNQLPYRVDFATGQFARYDAASTASTASTALNTTNSSIKVGLSHSNRNSRYDNFMQQLAQIVPQIERVEAGSAYKFCLMLEGQIDLYPRFHPTSEWDTSAGQALLESIGGGLYDLTGKAFRYNKRDTLLNAGFIASVNPDLGALAFAVLSEISTATK